jgi:glycosyltransferase involved in cell wall biosynthesis
MKTISRIGLEGYIESEPEIEIRAENGQITKRLKRTTALIVVEAPTSLHSLTSGLQFNSKEYAHLENLVPINFRLPHNLGSPDDTYDWFKNLRAQTEGLCEYVIFCKSTSVPSDDEVVSIVNSAVSLRGNFVISSAQEKDFRNEKARQHFLQRSDYINSDCFLMAIGTFLGAPNRILEIFKGFDSQLQHSAGLQLWKNTFNREYLENPVKNNHSSFVARAVLIVDYEIPDPTRDAGSVTLFNAMMMFRDLGFEVTFFPLRGASTTEDKVLALADVGVAVVQGTSVEEFVKFDGAKFDVVFMFRPGTAQAVAEIFRDLGHKAKLIFHTVDLHFLRMQRQAALTANRALAKEADEMREVELSLIRLSDLSLVHSTEEKSLLSGLGMDENSIVVDPLVLDFPETWNPYSRRRNMLFVGGFSHEPNRDAVIYFIKSVMPILRGFDLGIKFLIVGSNVGHDILSLECEDVVVLGHVPDLFPVLNTTRLAVAPLRFGAGVKGKVGLSLMSGLPTVASPIAIEGMGLTDGIEVMAGSDPQSFAIQIRDVYTDESKWSLLRENGKIYAKNNWGYEVGLRRLQANLTKMGLEVDSL